MRVYQLGQGGSAAFVNIRDSSHVIDFDRAKMVFLSMIKIK